MNKKNNFLIGGYSSLDVFLAMAMDVYEISQEMEVFFRSFDFALGSLESLKKVFDFSVVSGCRKRQLRFTLNDSVCRGMLLPFIEKYITDSNVYNIELFKKYCGLFSENSNFEVGMQWTEDEKFPTVKAYFEESPYIIDFFKSEVGRQKIKRIFNAQSLPGLIPDIICADFKPGGAFDLKTYSITDCMPENMPKTIQFPVHYSELACFYGEMDGVCTGRKKYYMAYPPDTISNPMPDLYEAVKILSSYKAADAVRMIQKWIRTLSSFSCVIVPTLFAMSEEGGCSVYLRPYKPGEHKTDINQQFIHR